jgi:hypothetical protein
MKINVNSLSKLTHAEKYSNVLAALTKNREILEEHVKRYSDKKDYDKIMEMYDENKQIVDMFKTFINNRELLMIDIIDVISKHQKNFIKESHLKPLCKKLGIQADYLQEEECHVRNISEIYAKVEENSNIVIIYDIEKKQFHQIKIERKFFAKIYSFYDINLKSVFYSGGVNNIQSKQKSYQNNFTQMKIKIKENEFQFEFKELPSMTYPRAGHIILEYGDFLIVVGGVNTAKCETYERKKEVWHQLPETPRMFPNPAASIMNNFLFVFSGSANIDSFDSIYSLSLNNLSKILKNDRGFENILNWEKVEYYFDSHSPSRLRRGMAALTVNNHSILLFGGFDYDNIYDQVYDFNLKNKNKTKSENGEEDEGPKEDEYVSVEEEGIQISQRDFLMPIKTFFNSNLLLIEDYLIMIDGYNNAMEFNMKTKEYFYYT